MPASLTSFLKKSMQPLRVDRNLKGAFMVRFYLISLKFPVVKTSISVASMDIWYHYFLPL
jgi:hypothetical protein